jgi:acetolactate synthase-1/2/3 large subunit
MADGYYRIADKPACTLLHCGPGLANGLGNLHNARRANSGIVNLVGDQATYHAPLDAPLTADADSLARTVSGWVRTSAAPQDVGRDAVAAIQAAKGIANNIATLILPSDACWGRGGTVAQPLPDLRAPKIDPHSIDAAAAALRSSGANVLILLGGRAFRAPSQHLAWRVAQATGASILGEFVAPRVERGAGRLPLERVPYGGDAAVKALSRFSDIVLVGARPPVGFFAYPDKPSRHYPSEARLHVLARRDQDVEEALAALVDALGSPDAPMPPSAARPGRDTGNPTPEGLARTLAAVMPEGAIVSDESISFGRGFYGETHGAPPHDWLHLTGGAIGDGLPVGTGAAVAAGGSRRVIGLQADGSAMYSLQSLWTQARERLPVTTVILSNRKYNILIGEYKGVGAVPGQTAMNMLDLSNPDIGWVGLAQALGVEAAQAQSLEQCGDLLESSFRRPGPFLIELVI